MGKEFLVDLESLCVGSALSLKYLRLSLLKKLFIMLGIVYAALYCKIVEN